MEHSGIGGFNTTHWSLVAGLQQPDADDTRARAALEHLCTCYWRPLYVFARRRHYAPDDARDITQAFLTRMIETRGLAGVDADRGRFRSYLLGAMKHFMSHEWERARAQKRGGAHRFVDWDVAELESRVSLSTPGPDDADLAFDEDWAREVVNGALARLRDAWTARDRGDQFDALKPGLTGDADVSHAALAEQLGMTENAVKVALHRLRRQYADLIREAVAETVAHADDVDDEVRYLIGVLRRK